MIGPMILRPRYSISFFRLAVNMYLDKVELYQAGMGESSRIREYKYVREDIKLNEKNLS